MDSRELGDLIHSICNPLPDVVEKDGVRKPLKTYCDRLMSAISKIPFVKRLDCNYHVSGMEMIIVDTHDNQKYHINIEPLREFYEENKE